MQTVQMTTFEPAKIVREKQFAYAVEDSATKPMAKIRVFIFLSPHSIASIMACQMALGGSITESR